jgi:hypothetical protein
MQDLFVAVVRRMLESKCIVPNEEKLHETGARLEHSSQKSQ